MRHLCTRKSWCSVGIFRLRNKGDGIGLFSHAWSRGCRSRLDLAACFLVHSAQSFPHSTLHPLCRCAAVGKQTKKSNQALRREQFISKCTYRYYVTMTPRSLRRVRVNATRSRSFLRLQTVWVHTRVSSCCVGWLCFTAPADRLGSSRRPM
jgi:hypothetical protein